MELGLAGRTAIVTGGSKGLGRAFAEELAGHRRRIGTRVVAETVTPAAWDEQDGPAAVASTPGAGRNRRWRKALGHLLGARRRSPSRGRLPQEFQLPHASPFL